MLRTDIVGAIEVERSCVRRGRRGEAVASRGPSGGHASRGASASPARTRSGRRSGGMARSAFIVPYLGLDRGRGPPRRHRRGRLGGRRSESPDRLDVTIMSRRSRIGPDRRAWYRRRIPSSQGHDRPSTPNHPQGRGLKAARSMNRAGNEPDPVDTRDRDDAGVDGPAQRQAVGSGTRRVSSRERRASVRGTASPGRMRGPPPTSACVEIVWCGAPNVGAG